MELQELRDLGFIINKPLRFGKNRVPFKDKRNLNGYIYVNSNNIAYGCWSDESIKGVIRMKEFIMSKQEVNKIKAQQIIEQEKSIDEMRDIFKKLPLNDKHTVYQDNKKLPSYYRCRVDNGNTLVLPMFNAVRKIVGLQYIYPNGDKRFSSGSKLQSSFLPIVKNGSKIEDAELILLSEGYANAHSLYEAFKDSVAEQDLVTICCFSSTNVDNVFQLLSKQYPDVPMLCVKDNDGAGLSVQSLGFTIGEIGEDVSDVYRRSKAELVRQLKAQLKNINYARP